MFDVLAEASRLLGDAVAVQPVDFIFDAQRLRLLVLISWGQRGDTRLEPAQRCSIGRALNTIRD